MLKFAKGNDLSEVHNVLYVCYHGAIPVAILFCSFFHLRQIIIYLPSLLLLLLLMQTC